MQSVVIFQNGMDKHAARSEYFIANHSRMVYLGTYYYIATKLPTIYIDSFSHND